MQTEALTDRLDAITLAVIQNGLQQVCNEMDLAFVRAAFSPVISEALDRSDGIYHATTGELIAQGELGLPVFVGTMQFGTQAVIERARDLAPGDLYIVNDPYLGGTHLMDVRFVKPYFYRGELFAWLANTGHWPDTGGMVPGGFSANATEVEQEGLRLPPVKLFKRGVMDEEILGHDCGTMINPLNVEGQIQGGMAHGVGNALFEWMRYDENAQPLTMNFGEYLLPSATEVPSADQVHLESPSPLNPLGVKGAGEGGTIPAPAAIAAAIEDALEPFGVEVDRVPVTPDWLLDRIDAARA